MSPNWLAYIALIGFVPAAVLVFARLPRAQAAACVVLAGSLFLPEHLAFDPPGLPGFGKEYITFLGALAGAIAYRGSSVLQARPATSLELFLLLSLLLANFGTVSVNGGAVFDEGVLEPGLGLSDVISHSADDLLGLALPFFVGRSLFTTREDLRTLMTMLAAAGIVYAGLVTIEVLVSIPWGQFHVSHFVYGIDTAGSLRWGMVQPHVFMDHGLAVATFMASAVLACAALSKARLRILGVFPKPALGLLLAAQVMCFNVAGIIYASTLTLVVTLLRPKNVARIAALLALLAFTYPMLRMWGLFPYAPILEAAADFDEERARSQKGRFDEEEYVLDVMGDRIWFGWGTITRVPGAEGRDRRRGGYEGGLDGYWVIELGLHGITGLELRMAFLVLPVWLAWRRHRRFSSVRVAALHAALMAIVAMRAVDLLPNGWWNSLPIFLAGALYGVSRSPEPPRQRRRRRRPVPIVEVSARPDSLSQILRPGGHSRGASSSRRSAMNAYPSALK